MATAGRHGKALPTEASGGGRRASAMEAHPCNRWRAAQCLRPTTRARRLEDRVLKPPVACGTDAEGETMEPLDVAEPADDSASCAFCHREALAGILAETDHFYLLADHAPLVEGHLLLIPRNHYACYGALPAQLEEEFLTLKRRVADFLGDAYRSPVFFEHGVFRQTVYHAHLHAIPFGPLNFGVHALAAADGRSVHTLGDVRSWYEERGPYFYIEQPPAHGDPAEAALFPPEERRYYVVLGMLRSSA